MRAAAAAVLALVVLAAGPRGAGAQDEARVAEVTPAVAGDLVVCRLRTAGLPGARLLQSMRSGLVSAVELDLAVVDDRERVVGGHRVSLQLAFDLWEEVFAVREGPDETRFGGLDGLQAYLADLRGVPVLPTDRLTAGARYRVRVGLQVHPIAPSAQDRVEDVVSGEPRLRREGQDQQEASVSLGRLIRFFYKGGDDGGAGRTAFSGWFTRRELPRATD